VWVALRGSKSPIARMRFITFDSDERGWQKIFESHACPRGIVFPRGCFRTRLEEFNQSA
jgi:hypothetical protein